MEQILVFLLVIVAIALVALVLLQQGKGADVGASFGSGASNTVFGSQGSGSFLMKLTFAFAAAFFIICIILARIAVVQSKATHNLNLPTTNMRTVPVKNEVKLNSNTSKSSVPVIPSNKK